MDEQMSSKKKTRQIKGDQVPSEEKFWQTKDNQMHDKMKFQLLNFGGRIGKAKKTPYKGFGEGFFLLDFICAMMSGVHV